MTTFAVTQGPKPLPMLGHSLSISKSPTDFFMKVAREHGDFVGIKVGHNQGYLVSHPDLIRDVLVTHHKHLKKGRGTQWLRPFLGEGLLVAEGDFHRRQRRLAQPAFTRKSLDAYDRVMTDKAIQAADAIADGEKVCMDKTMMQTTLVIAAEAFFGLSMESDAKLVSHALDTFMDLWYTNMNPITRALYQLPLPKRTRSEESKAVLDKLVYGIIEKRRAEGGDHVDLLGMFMAAQDTEGDGGGMSDKQLRDELVTTIMAGHETTATGLMWTWYLLAKNPEVERRFHEELDQVLAGRTPTHGDVDRLEYTRLVFMESMRLFPPAWMTSRYAVEPFELAGHPIEEGDLIFVSQFNTHRDPRWYDDPLKFDPDRWNTEKVKKNPKFAYFPFGGGIRQCIGERFAWMEAILMLAVIGQRLRFTLEPGQEAIPQPMITLRPKDGLSMTAHRRR